MTLELFDNCFSTDLKKNWQLFRLFPTNAPTIVSQGSSNPEGFCQRSLRRRRTIFESYSQSIERRWNFHFSSRGEHPHWWPSRTIHGRLESIPTRQQPFETWLFNDSIVQWQCAQWFLLSMAICHRVQKPAHKGRLVCQSIPCGPKDSYKIHDYRGWGISVQVLWWCTNAIVLLSAETDIDGILSWQSRFETLQGRPWIRSRSRKFANVDPRGPG